MYGETALCCYLYSCWTSATYTFSTLPPVTTHHNTAADARCFATLHPPQNSTCITLACKNWAEIPLVWCVPRAASEIIMAFVTLFWPLQVLCCYNNNKHNRSTEKQTQKLKTESNQWKLRKEISPRHTLKPNTHAQVLQVSCRQMAKCKPNFTTRRYGTWGSIHRG